MFTVADMPAIIVNELWRPERVFALLSQTCDREQSHSGRQGRSSRRKSPTGPGDPKAPDTVQSPVEVLIES